MPEMGFREKYTARHFATKCAAVKFVKLNVEPLLRIGRSQLRRFGHVSRMFQERLARQVPRLHPRERKAVQRSSKDQVEWLHLTLLGLVLVWTRVVSRSGARWGISCQNVLGPHVNLFRNDGHFRRQWLLKQSSWLNLPLKWFTC